MKHFAPLAAVVLLLACAGAASANGFVITYPPDSDNLNLDVGSPENVEVHLKNGLDVEVAVGLSDDASSVVSVNYPVCFLMQPGGSEVVNLTVVPRSSGSFDVAVHVEVKVPEEQGGPMGGQIIGGLDIPLRGSVSGPPAPEGFPWPYIIIAIVVVGGAAAYAVKRWWVR